MSTETKAEKDPFKLLDLYALADKFLLDDLRAEIGVILSFPGMVTRSNVFSLYCRMRPFGKDELYTLHETCVQVFTKMRFIQSRKYIGSFQEMDFQSVVALIKEAYDKPEIDKFRYVKAWAIANKNENVEV